MSGDHWHNTAAMQNGALANIGGRASPSRLDVSPNASRAAEMPKNSVPAIAGTRGAKGAVAMAAVSG